MKIKKLIQKAVSGDANAMARLAWKYDEGDGFRKSYRKAFEWYLKAAKSEHVPAQYNLNLFYLLGHGTAKDDKKAFYWAKKAAAANDADAMLALGWHYHNGRGVKKDLRKAEQWYLKAADLGEVSAYFSLGQIYYDKRTYTQAMPWFDKGVREDHKKCLYYLGRMHLEGKGTHPDFSKAKALLKGAVGKGYFPAKRLVQSKRFKTMIKTKG